MPIYEYLCEACGHEMESLQKIKDEPLKDCPSCGKSTLRKLVSAAGFRLKGEGWYETDFKQGNQRNVIKKDQKSEDKADKKSDTPKDKTDKKAGQSKSTDTSNSKTG